MNYHGNDYTTDIEDLLMDFLVYRKNKKSESYKIQENFEIGKGWPYYKNMALETEPENTDVKAPAEEPAAAPPLDNTMPEDYQTPSPSVKPETEFPLPLEKIDALDKEFVKLLFSEINKRLIPVVMEVLQENNYAGSPTNDMYMDKEALAQIVDQVIDRAKDNIGEVDEITMGSARNDWDRYRLLRALVEALILCELGKYPRHGKKSISKANWNKNYL